MAGYLAGDVDEWIYIDIADQQIEFIPVKDIKHGQPSVILRIVSSNGYRESLYGLDPEMSKDDEHNWMIMIHENIKNNL